MPDYERGYHQGYADAMNWKTQNHLEHLPGREPTREWVGLTTDEINKSVVETSTDVFEGDIYKFATALETILKEKNSG